MNYRWYLIVWFLLPICLHGQVFPSFLKLVKACVTEDISFDKNDFKSDSQFWTMCEDTNGVLIFGNNEGILIFDGEYWKTIKLPNSSSVRSLLIDAQGVIWVGGYNEIGNLKKDSFGNYYYHSLIDELLLNNSNLENNWQIHSFKDKVVYRSFKELIVISGKSATHIKSNQSFVYSGIINGHLIVQDANHGIYKLNDEADKLVPLFNLDAIENDIITASFPVNNTEAFLITIEGTILLANIVSKKIIKKTKLFEKGHIDPINCGVQKNDSTFLLGTLSSKIIELKKDGSINRTNITFSKLKSTAIHNFYKLKSNNIWVLHNNGIAYLDFNSQYANIFDNASVYDVLIDDKTIYLATNEGVYYINKFQDFNFKINKIEDLPGQAWSLTKLEGDILISHNDGLFVLKNNIPEQIGNRKGFWKITSIKDKKNQFLASNYNGLFLLEKQQNKWVIKHQIIGFDESTRDILPAEDANTFWVCHGYKGVYKLVINPDYTRVESVEQFTAGNGFKSPFSINVVNYNGKMVFTTNTGIYTYNKKSKTFEPYAALNKILDTTKNTRKLLYTKDKTWVVQDDEAGYFLNNNSKKQLVKSPFLNLKGLFNKGMESILPFEDYVFLASNKGLFLYNIHINKRQDANTIFTNISYIKDKARHYAPIASTSAIEFPNATDKFRFEFTAPRIAPYQATEYSYFLGGLDSGWAEWSSNPFKEYTKLPQGNYVFKVKSRSQTGIEGTQTSYSFKILPMWYQTAIAYIIYNVVFLILVYLAYRLILKKIEAEKRKTKLETLKDQKLVRLELQQLKLSIEQQKIKEDNTHLEMDLIDKSKELANYTLLLSKRKEAFQELNNDLKQLKDLVKTSESKNKITQIFKKLNENKITDKYLEIFDVNFERVHTHFFKDLKRINPAFSQRELRLCALIKMNLTNKEISHILNISARGVETARYRIRKKINLPVSESLTLFLENLNPPQ